MYKNDGWNTERRDADNVPAGRGSDVPAGRKFEYPALPQTLEELELEYKREAMDLGRIRDKEEDEENYKHREVYISVHFSLSFVMPSGAFVR